MVESVKESPTKQMQGKNHGNLRGPHPKCHPTPPKNKALGDSKSYIHVIYYNHWTTDMDQPRSKTSKFHGDQISTELDGQKQCIP